MKMSVMNAKEKEQKEEGDKTLEKGDVSERSIFVFHMPRRLICLRSGLAALLPSSLT
jgi:hypothetical protein